MLGVYLSLYACRNHVTECCVFVRLLLVFTSTIFVLLRCFIFFRYVAVDEYVRTTLCFCACDCGNQLIAQVLSLFQHFVMVDGAEN